MYCNSPKFFTAIIVRKINVLKISGVKVTFKVYISVYFVLINGNLTSLETNFQTQSKAYTHFAYFINSLKPNGNNVYHLL
jgi:hypothetical protein